MQAGRKKQQFAATAPDFSPATILSYFKDTGFCQ
jgi:hypothetical protein